MLSALQFIKSIIKVKPDSMSTNSILTDSDDSFLTYYRNLPSNIYYTTDSEYRASIRKIFGIDESNVITPYSSYDKEDMCEPKEMDDISKDETRLDSRTLDGRMDILYNLTYEHDFFSELYESAAGQMLSTDLKIGQAVVCSYDTFAMYHTAIWLYLVRGDVSKNECKELYKYFHSSNI